MNVEFSSQSRGTAVRGRRVLLLALTPLGWGETAFAIHLAAALQESGYGVRVITQAMTVALFAGTGVPYETVSDDMLPLLPLLLDGLVEDFCPDVIVLCDIVTTERAFRHVGADPERLFQYNIPVIGVDTWDGLRTGSMIDLFAGESLEVATWSDLVPRRLRPVPFLSPLCGPGACQYLPSPARAARHVREHVRREFGVGAKQRIILFCTAAWQHIKYDNVDGERLAAQLPLLVANYLALLGDSVHLVHIGPGRYPLDDILQGRYHWMPPQSPQILSATMAASDLLLSANPSATTVAKAVVSGMPVVVLQNSIRAASRDAALAQLESPVMPVVESWLDATLPLYPFALWPLGYYHYLQSVFGANPYLQAVATVELCEGAIVLETLQTLLFKAESRDQLHHAQMGYLNLVRRLPEPLVMMEELMSGNYLATATEHGGGL
jgi:hypothetical protein